MIGQQDDLRSALALTLTVCLLPFPAAAHEASPGPITGAIRREAERLVANQDPAASEPDVGQRATPPSDWSRLFLVATGTKLIVTIKGEQPRRWTFGTADAFQLSVHDSTGQAVMIARGDVAEIEAFAIHRSVTAAIVAAAGGVVLGGYLAMRLGLSVRCQPSCGGVEAGILLSAIGIPVAAGFGGYYASGVSTANVIYRAPYLLRCQEGGPYGSRRSRPRTSPRSRSDMRPDERWSELETIIISAR